MANATFPTTYRSLLVPLDGSPFAEQAVPVALGIARRAGAGVQVVTVLPQPTLFSRQSASQLAGHWGDYLRGVAERARDESGVPVSSQVLQGPAVAPALCAHARDASADLVVMSTRGRGALGRLWFGSVAAEVVPRLSMPVLLVRPGDRDTERQELAVRHVLVTLDGSPLAERALEPALALGTLTGADYTLLRVVPDVLVAGGPGLDPIALSSPVLGVLEEVRAVQERLRQEAQDYLDGVAGRLRARGVQVQTRLAVAGDPGSAILDALAGSDIDLVALETHGGHGSTGRYFGSVARKLIHGTSKPVLVHSAGAPRPNNP